MPKSTFKDRWGFDQWAKSYDEDITQGTHSEKWVFEDYDQILDKIVDYCDLSLNDYASVLDIGIGTGNLASRFLKRDLRVIGIDPSKEMRKICNRKYPNLKVKSGDFLRIPLPPRSIDVVASSYAFHHLTPAQKETSIPGMKRVLKAKGRVVIADLMFRDVSEEKQIKRELRESGRVDVIDAIEDEYFGSFEDLCESFRNEGFTFHGEQLTPFVWIFRACLTDG